MAEPISSSFGLTKIILGVAGLFGGVAISIFWQPKKIKQKGMLAAVAIIGALSFGFAFAFGGIAARAIGVDLQNPDDAMAVGVAIGAISVGMVSFLANWLSKREDKDIGEVIKDARADIKDAI
jgi:MFS family permease